MSDEVLESGQETQEPLEQPKPAAPSVPSGVQPTSAPKSEADDLAKLEEVIDRRFQSFKDRRLSKVDEMAEKLDQLLSQMDDQPAAAPSSEPVPGRTGGGDQAYMEAMSAQLLDSAGIAYDDAEYSALAEQYGGRISNPEQWITLVREHVSKRSSKEAKQASVTEAAVVVPGGSVAGAVSGDSVEDYADELEQIQMGERGSPHKPENLKRMQELSDKINELDPKVDLDDPNVIIDRASLSRLYK